MTYPFPIYDAHNHLQDDRLRSQFPSIIQALEEIPIRKAVVNGTCESDWPAVARLAATYGWVIPSAGLHPWFVNRRSENWEGRLSELLDSEPHKWAIGEIGLDRWIDGHDIAAQEQVFRVQLRHAASRNLPLSIHCIQAWGLMLDILQDEELPVGGFLLHSYGGPAEMIAPFAELGGYFSLSGYFAHPRKERQREVFKRVPLDRLLLETDAPDMTPPSSHALHFLSDSHGGDLNHPANIPAVYEFASELYAVPMEQLAIRIENNFKRLFGGITRQNSGTNR